MLPTPPNDRAIEAVDIDPKRPNVKAKCPFCGGTYMAGYRVTRPEVRVVWHSFPPVCDVYENEPHKAAFLTRARLAGAVRMRIHEGEPATPVLLDADGKPLRRN